MTNKINVFGIFFREKRLSLKKGLREFCLENKLDAGNLSRIENGTKPPSDDILIDYVRALKIEKNSDDWFKFFDLAAVARKEIPSYVYNNVEFVKALPILFRKAETGEAYTEQELRAIANTLEEDKFDKSAN